MTSPEHPIAASYLRRIVLLVAALNLAYFGVEIGVALSIRSVSLLADSVDFLEDAAINLLIFVAFGWSLARRSVLGKVMAGIILIPALAAVYEAVVKLSDPSRPDPTRLIITAGGAVLVNTVCALLLARIRHHGGSLSHAAYLAARNDVVANLAIIAVGALSLVWVSGWPDIVLGLGIVALNATAAREVWEVAEEERLAAKALAGEAVDDD